MSDITAQDIQDAEKQIAGLEELVKRRGQALRLAENPDFKDLILKYYFVEECSRLVHLSGDPAQSEKDRAIALSMAQATGHLKRFLSATMQMGYVAERDIHEHKEALEQIKIEFEQE